MYSILFMQESNQENEMSSNLRRSTEGNAQGPAKYLLFLKDLKNGCCSSGEENAVDDWSAALRVQCDQGDMGECCWASGEPAH